MPQSIDAEVSVLGSCLIDPYALDKIQGSVTPKDFYRPQHEHIFAAMLGMHRAGTEIDLVTLGDGLQESGHFDDIGGTSYLADLMAKVPTATNVEHYAKTVANRALARRTISVAGKIAAIGYEEINSPDTLLERVQAETYGIINSTPTGSKVFDPFTLAAEFKAHLEKVLTDPEAAGITTGFPDLDRYIGGLRKGEVTIVAARPSVGKTALGECISEHVAGEGRFVVFASLEMTRTQLLARRASRIGHLPAGRLMRGNLPSKKEDPKFWKDLDAALKKIGNTGIWLIDDPRATTSSLRANLSRARLRKGKSPDLIVIDYLQLLKDYAGREDGNSRIEYISGQVKAIARDFDCPVLCLSQLNRQVEYRKEKNPQLADLRGSGAIEQDADVVILMKRRDLEDGTRDRRTELVIKKNRNGETGKTNLTFRPDYVEFTPHAPERVEGSYAA